LLGGLVDAAVCTIRIQGVDIGNLGCGFPGQVQGFRLTPEFFLLLSQYHQGAWIPVFNSANKTSITVDAVQNQAAGAINVVLHLVELPPGTVPPAVQGLPAAA
jgi:hypothetical protein